MRDISPASPESRRKRLASMRAAFGTDVEEKLKPRLTAWEVIKRVAITEESETHARGVGRPPFEHALVVREVDRVAGVTELERVRRTQPPRGARQDPRGTGRARRDRAGVLGRLRSESRGASAFEVLLHGLRRSFVNRAERTRHVIGSDLPRPRQDRAIAAFGDADRREVVLE